MTMLSLKFARVAGEMWGKVGEWQTQRFNSNMPVLQERAGPDLQHRHEQVWEIARVGSATAALAPSPPSRNHPLRCIGLYRALSTFPAAWGHA